MARRRGADGGAGCGRGGHAEAGAAEVGGGVDRTEHSREGTLLGRLFVVRGRLRIVDLEAAHKASSLHRTAIEASEVVGCFYCLKTYSPRKIEDWCDDDQTALCARCSIDSVIGSASGWPLTPEFLREMHRHWFERTVPWSDLQPTESWWRRVFRRGT